MKLKDLLKKVTVQGDVRISVWDIMGEEEVIVREFSCMDSLRRSDVMELGDMEICYMFAAPNGVLHIELDINSMKEKKG